MKTTLKQIAFTWQDDELTIERDGFIFAVPKRYIGSLQIFLARIYRKEFRKHAKK